MSEDGPGSTNASFWCALFSNGGPGHVLYIKFELTDNRWRNYTDNIGMTRWLQNSIQGLLNAETADMSIPVTEAEFSKYGDFRDSWTECIESYDEEIEMTWHNCGEPLLIRTEPSVEKAYGVCTVLVPALGARLTHNGV